MFIAPSFKNIYIMNTLRICNVWFNTFHIDEMFVYLYAYFRSYYYVNWITLINPSPPPLDLRMLCNKRFVY